MDPEGHVGVGAQPCPGVSGSEYGLKLLLQAALPLLHACTASSQRLAHDHTSCTRASALLAGSLRSTTEPAR